MKSFFKEFIRPILIVIIVAYLMMRFILYPFEVIGTSMKPNLLPNEFGFGLRIKKLFGLARFDIVVLDMGDENNKLLVKRIIGMPNETVEYKDNVLYINGEVVEQDFLSEDVTTNDFVVELKEDEYFCLGDNRELSRDSRYYGPFNEEQIVSVGAFIIIPFEEIGFH